MKKTLFLTENESKRILDLHKNAILNEQTYYIGADGKPGIAPIPQVPPTGAKTVTKQEYDAAMKGTVAPNPAVLNVTQNTPLQPQTPAGTQTPTNTQTPPPAKENNQLALQKLLNTKFQAGLKEDGKVGPLTIAAALKALGGNVSSGTQTPASGTQTPASGTQTPAGTQTPSTGASSFSVTDGNF